jgi:hypothetical protein
MAIRALKPVVDLNPQATAAAEQQPGGYDLIVQQLALPPAVPMATIEPCADPSTA